MPRRQRRSGVVLIENDKERNVTFYKRRRGLYKAASDLSVLTGARVAVVLEAENGNIHSFGTPSAKPIVDAFLSGTAPPVDEAKASEIARLQSEVAQFDKENTIKDKRNQVSIQHMKKINEDNPGMVANLVLLKEEDLSLEDLYKLFNELSRDQEGIQNHLPPLEHGQEAKIGGQSLKRSMQPPVGLSYNHVQTTPLWQHSAWSHHPLQQQVASAPPPTPPQQTLSPLHSMKEKPPPHDLHLQNYPSPYTTEQPPQNYVGPTITFKHNLEESLLPNSSVNYFSIDGPVGYDPWGYPLSDNVYNNRFLGMDAYLGHNGTNV